MNTLRPLSTLAVAVMLAACGTSSGPARERADFGVAAQLPSTSSTTTTTTTTASSKAARLEWQDFVRDTTLREWISQALAHNRDLRVALINVERAQAQLNATGAARWPSLGAGAGAQRAPNTMGLQTNTFTLGLQVPAWEVDLFGRLSAIDEAARAQLLSSEAGARAAQIALIAQVMQAALALRADTQLLAIAERTAATREESLRLVTLREKQGASSLIDLDTQLLLAEQARAAVAQYQRQRAQDLSAMQLLVGQPFDESHAETLKLGSTSGLGLSSTAGQGRAATLNFDASAWDAVLSEVPAGLDATVLLERPDVIQAERQLEAAYANLQAARRALWPTITLTGQAGQASASLSDLLKGGHFAYALAANAFASIFDGGRRQANIDAADSSERIALAQYEKAVQSAFRETADGLSAVDTWRRQRAALEGQAKAARELARLVNLKAERGAASLLEQLEAERTHFAAEQAAVLAQQAELASRVGLWKALGR
jgi:outer membrane protein, multidrug efflux system